MIDEKNTFITSVIPKYIKNEVNKICRNHKISQSIFYRFCIEQYLCIIKDYTDEQLEYVLKYLKQYKKIDINNKKLEKQIKKYCEV